jgi:hypothetical protein
MLTTTPRRRAGLLARLPLALATTVASVLAVWCVVLALSLPGRAVAPHWSITWVGLDAGEAVTAALTALLIRRHRPAAALTATMCATLLIADAWFDVWTSAAGSAQVIAGLQAAFLELPLAGAALWFAARTLSAGGASRPRRAASRAPASGPGRRR